MSPLGANTIATITLKNLGTQMANVTLTKSTTAAWFDLSSVPASVTLAPEESKSYAVSVNAPASRGSTTQATATIRGTVQQNTLISDAAELTVILGPLAWFESAHVAPYTLGFTDYSMGAIQSRTWSFGDGTTSALKSPTHKYAQAGTYTITLTVAGPDGTDVATITRQVTATGSANYTYLPTVSR